MKLKQSQSGVVLVICLVLLLVVTVLGVASMSSTSAELKMASKFRDRSVATEVAEETLVVAENWISDTALTVYDFDNSCTGTTCFKSSCDNGLCAFYDSTNPFLHSTDPAACRESMKPPQTPPWEWAGASGEPNLWLDDNKSVQVTPTNPDVSVAGRYIIEFMCFVDKTDSVECELNTTGTCAPQFRITALARGLTDSSLVMLQSIYKKVN